MEAVQRALDAAAAERTRHEWWSWTMTREQRVAAFFRHERTLDDCLASARRFPSEPGARRLLLSHAAQREPPGRPPRDRRGRAGREECFGHWRTFPGSLQPTSTGSTAIGWIPPATRRRPADATSTRLRGAA